jgi:ADP-ribose pyrophosphatase
MSNANCKMVFVEIDGTDPRNQNPVAKNDDGEFIEVFSVPVPSLLKTLTEWDSQGVKISAQLYDFALGLNYSNLLHGKL